MAQTVIGVFDNSRDAQNAVDNLVSNGFSRSSIDISNKSDSAYGSTSGSTYDKRDRDGDGDVDFGDKVGNFFSSLFGGDEADKYSRVASKSCVVTVHAQSMAEAERAADILDEYGSVDVNDRAMKLGYGSSAAPTGFVDTTTSGYADTSRLDTDRLDTDTSFRDRDTIDSEKSIPIIEENLNVGKREVTTGGVRLRSRIVERPVEEHLRLREEHVTVERNPVNRPASAADLNNFQEGTIEMTEHAEQAMVNKEARIVEEVRLNKEVTERDEVVRDTVRRTDVDVENLTGTDKDRYDKDRLDLDNDRNRLDNDRRLDSDDLDLNRPAGL
ncbi:YsnF/AvaK domain-containing protein [Rhodocytophaga aerolata]|uniref:YsnF/AvaK domain-containing protein n=1 Tax=Rhodocytophaga aerolata TaxID=455078 RepID=A0ABT8RBB7_9BACT|nr:YsnF/AvaK domain-containing protein [Rhodocytophaga aerolata]MDO1448047.1 YsnF/AvaK domain-containing protein [Rhodocytophaga aerolata]